MDIGLKHTEYQINNSDSGHTRSKAQSDKNLKITFASPSKNALEKKKENDGNCKAFCVTSKRNNKERDLNGAKDPYQIKSNHLIWKLRLPILSQNIISPLMQFQQLLISMH